METAINKAPKISENMLQNKNWTLWRMCPLRSDWPPRPAILARTDKTSREAILKMLTSSPSDSRLSVMEHLQGMLALLQITEAVVSPATKEDIFKAAVLVQKRVQGVKRTWSDVLDDEDDEETDDEEETDIPDKLPRSKIVKAKGNSRAYYSEFCKSAYARARQNISSKQAASHKQSLTNVYRNKSNLDMNREKAAKVKPRKDSWDKYTGVKKKKEATKPQAVKPEPTRHAAIPYAESTRSMKVPLYSITVTVQNDEKPQSIDLSRKHAGTDNKTEPVEPEGQIPPYRKSRTDHVVQDTKIEQISEEGATTLWDIGVQLKLLREEAEKSKKSPREEAEEMSREEAEKSSGEAEESSREEHKKTSREEAEEISKEEAEKSSGEAEESCREEHKKTSREEAKEISKEEAEKSSGEAEESCREEHKKTSREEAEEISKEESEKSSGEAEESSREEHKKTSREEAEEISKEEAEKSSGEAEESCREEHKKTSREEAEEISKEEAEKSSGEAEESSREEHKKTSREEAETSSREEAEYSRHKAENSTREEVDVREDVENSEKFYGEEPDNSEMSYEEEAEYYEKASREEAESSSREESEKFTREKAEKSARKKAAKSARKKAKKSEKKKAEKAARKKAEKSFREHAEKCAREKAEKSFREKASLPIQASQAADDVPPYRKRKSEQDSLQPQDVNQASNRIVLLPSQEKSARKDDAHEAQTFQTNGQNDLRRKLQIRRKPTDTPGVKSTPAGEAAKFTELVAQHSAHRNIQQQDSASSTVAKQSLSQWIRQPSNRPRKISPLAIPTPTQSAFLRPQDKWFKDEGCGQSTSGPSSGPRSASLRPYSKWGNAHNTFSKKSGPGWERPQDKW